MADIQAKLQLYSSIFGGIFTGLSSCSNLDVLPHKIQQLIKLVDNFRQSRYNNFSLLETHRDLVDYSASTVLEFLRSNNPYLYTHNSITGTTHGNFYILCESGSIPLVQDYLSQGPPISYKQTHITKIPVLHWALLSGSIEMLNYIKSLDYYQKLPEGAKYWDRPYMCDILNNAKSKDLLDALPELFSFTLESYVISMNYYPAPKFIYNPIFVKYISDKIPDKLILIISCSSIAMMDLVYDEFISMGRPIDRLLIFNNFDSKYLSWISKKFGSKYLLDILNYAKTIDDVKSISDHFEITRDLVLNVNYPIGGYIITLFKWFDFPASTLIEHDKRYSELAAKSLIIADEKLLYELYKDNQFSPQTVKVGIEIEKSPNKELIDYIIKENDVELFDLISQFYEDSWMKETLATGSMIITHVLKLEKINIKSDDIERICKILYYNEDAEIFHALCRHIDLNTHFDLIKRNIPMKLADEFKRYEKLLDIEEI